MSSKMTRREALRLGTSTAIATSPLLSSSIARAAEPVYKMPNSADEICSMRAVDMVDAIRTKKVSSREVMQAHLKQIGRVNARVNAMVTMVPEDQLMAQALAADEALANGKWLGPLHGLPVAVKDLHEPVASALRMALPCIKTMCRISIAGWCRGRKRLGRSCWVKRTCLSSALVRKPSIQSSVLRTILTIRRRPVVEVRVGAR